MCIYLPCIFFHAPSSQGKVETDESHILPQPQPQQQRCGSGSGSGGGGSSVVFPQSPLTMSRFSG
jgi:hypothetical protein